MAVEGGDFAEQVGKTHSVQLHVMISFECFLVCAPTRNSDILLQNSYEPENFNKILSFSLTTLCNLQTLGLGQSDRQGIQHT